jgi:hypothetical protein
MSDAVANQPERTPPWVRKIIEDEAKADEAEKLRLLKDAPSAEVIPFPAMRQRRYLELQGEHLYTRSEGLREWKRHLKRVGVAPERIDAEIETMALALGFRKFRG